MASWNALHIFLWDAEKTDRFLAEILAQEITALLSETPTLQWFFIRYWEGSPHIRLRVKGLSIVQLGSLKTRLNEAVRVFVSGLPLTAETYYQGHRFDGASVDISALPWYPEGTVVEIDYQPELRRYGGSQAMPINELLFERSSALALAIVRATLGKPQTRLLQALDLMVIAAAVLFPTAVQSQEYFRHYGEQWKAFSASTVDAPEDRSAFLLQMNALAPRVQKLLAREHRQGSGTVADAWARYLRDYIVALAQLSQEGGLLSPINGRPTRQDADRLAAETSLLTSQMHMLNNRLGIIPMQEYEIARLLDGALAVDCITH